jgi:hypothetical protein
MAEPITTLAGLALDLIKLVADKVKQTRENHTCLQRLVKNVQLLSGPLQTIAREPPTPDNPELYDSTKTALQEFKKTLQELHQLAAELAGMGKVMRFLKSSSNAERLADISTGITELIPVIHLHVSASTQAHFGHFTKQMLKEKQASDRILHQASQLGAQQGRGAGQPEHAAPAAAAAEDSLCDAMEGLSLGLPQTAADLDSAMAGNDLSAEQKQARGGGFFTEPHAMQSCR